MGREALQHQMNRADARFALAITSASFSLRTAGVPFAAGNILLDPRQPLDSKSVPPSADRASLAAQFHRDVLVLQTVGRMQHYLCAGPASLVA